MLLYVASIDQGKAKSTDFRPTLALTKARCLNLPHFWSTHQRATWQIVPGLIKTPRILLSLNWSILNLPCSVICTDGLLFSQHYLRTNCLFLLKCVFPSSQYKCITWSSRVLLELEFPLILGHTDGTKSHHTNDWNQHIERVKKPTVPPVKYSSNRKKISK